jgi:hypothetical protein
MGKGTRDGDNGRRRDLTLHSFRRFVKTTISDLGYADFSEWFIGHSGSTYWTKKDKDKEEIFLKIEPYLTFLNMPHHPNVAKPYRLIVVSIYYSTD